MKILAPLGAVLIFAFLGCTDATGSLQGGDPLSLGNATDDGGTSLLEGGATIVTSLDCLDGGAHQGSGWQDLYACYFGPMGIVTCGVSGGQCHASSTDTGAMASNGFVCGPASDACLSAVKSAMPSLGRLVPTGPTSDPTSFHLYQVLCQISGSGMSGSMPFGCSVYLRAGDMSRIATWIRGGAQNN